MTSETIRRRSFLAATAAAGASTLLAQQKGWLMFVGTYTKDGKSKGIYSWRLEPSGKITPIGLAAETSNPSFLAIHPSRRWLYAVNEDDDGAMSSFAIANPAGMLKPINKVSTKGGWPCHVVFDHTGKVAYAANYKTGSVASFLVGKDGSIGEAAAVAQHSGTSVDKERQEGPHAHMAAISPDNKYVLTPDLGIDKVMIYHVDTAKATLAPTGTHLQLPPGTGPRHLAFSKDGKFVYVLGELKATVNAFAWDAGRASGNGVQTISMLPADFKGQPSGAEIFVHPNGKFLYASNRAHDSIALFQIDTTKGTLTADERAPTRGKTPRSFAIDPTGNFIFAANQDSDTIATFRIDLSTGRLSAVGDLISCAQPVCIVFVAAR